MLSISNLKEEINMSKNKNKMSLEQEYESLRMSLSERDIQQEKVLITNSNRYLVKGPAGSGKTLIALRKVYEIVSKGQFSFNIIIFTKALKEYLEARFNLGFLQNIEDKIFYMHEYDKSEAIMEINKDVDYIIIDEVQDFSFAELETIVNKAKKGFFLFGDNGQQIYPERTNNENVIQEVENSLAIDLFCLERTFRVPKKIADFASCIDKRNTQISQNCFRSEGDKPRIIEFSSVKSEAIYIINIIQQEGWKNVGILLKNNNDVREFVDLMRKYSMVCEYKIGAESTLDFTRETPKVMTFHSAKGLEFERVFIPRCSYNDNPEKYNYREALFVAITRAKETVIMSYIEGDKNQYLDEFNTNTYQYLKKGSE